MGSDLVLPPPAVNSFFFFFLSLRPSPVLEPAPGLRTGGLHHFHRTAGRAPQPLGGLQEVLCGQLMAGEFHPKHPKFGKQNTGSRPPESWERHKTLPILRRKKWGDESRVDHVGRSRRMWDTKIISPSLPFHGFILCIRCLREASYTVLNWLNKNRARKSVANVGLLIEACYLY